MVFYLGEHDETKSTCRYLIDTINNDNESKSYRYYLDNMTFYYAVSRVCAWHIMAKRGKRRSHREGLEVQQRDHGSFGNELATACAVCSLAKFEYDDVTRLRDAARYLEQQQRADGSWRRVAMFHGSGVYFGSEELTTALCLEALTHVATR